jgi:hypothetical protein
MLLYSNGANFSIDPGLTVPRIGIAVRQAISRAATAAQPIEHAFSPATMFQ